MTEQDNRQTPQRGVVGRRPVDRRPVQGRTSIHNNSSVHKVRPQTAQISVNKNDQKHSATPATRRVQGTSTSSRTATSNTSNKNQNQERRKESSLQKRSSLTYVDKEVHDYQPLLTNVDSNNEADEHHADISDIESEDRWIIDAKTGVKHKELNRIPKNVLSAMHKVAKSGGTPSSSELRFIPREKDFNSIDAFTGAGMDAMAETFLGHLRVPPNEDELKRLREEYIRRQKKAEEDYQHEQSEITSTSGDDNLTYF